MIGIFHLWFFEKVIIGIFTAAAAAIHGLAASTPAIVSSQVRANDPTVLDVVYRVTSDKPTVNVRALAFEDGERLFWKVVRPETFIDGTAANLGDNIAANTEHKLSWKVSSDWATDLAKCKFEVLVSEQGTLPMDLITIPGVQGKQDLTVSFNAQTSADVFNAVSAFLSPWLYSGNPDFDIIYSALQGTSGCFNDNLGVLSGEIESRVTTRTCSFSVNVENLLKNDMSCEGSAVADYSAGRFLCTHVFFRGFRQPTPRTRVRGTRPLIAVSERI